MEETFDKTTKEGRLLYAAICMLRSDGPEPVQGKDLGEILVRLDELAGHLENYRM